jgi:hypothetical protein
MAGMHACARRRPRAGTVTVLSLAAVLSACADDATLAGPPDPGRDPRPDFEVVETSVPPVVPRVDLGFEVNGAFRPGLPIAITAVARGRRQADQMTLELLVHDEPAPTGTPPEQAGRRRVGTLQGGVGRGAERRLSGTVTFASPGFYRVSAHAVTSGPTPDIVQGDSLIMDVTDETLYILIEENGGRRLDRFDATAFAGRMPLFGSYGPFVPGARVRGAGPAAALLSPTGDPARQTSTAYTYWIEYDNDDVAAKRPVAGATAEIKCLDASYAPTGNPVYPTVNTDGSFSFTCPYGYFDGSVLLRDWYSEVVKEDRTTGGVSYFNEYTTNRRLVAASKHAAHVFVLLHTYVPVVEQRFGGRWRQRLPVWVSDTAGARYLPTKDTVNTNVNRVFREDGRFVTMHEYGHAYQYKAIETWSQTTACPVHYTHLPSHRECAFPEGFATFLAVWVAGNELTTGHNTDNGIETQTFYTNGDGINIEGSVAGFLYDMVDGSGQRDNAANTAAQEETWDTAVFPGSFIADVMASCSLYQASTGAYTQYLSGADQLVYCLEGNVSAEGYTSYWRTTWDSLTRTATNPAGYSSTLVRTLWRRNLYGVP